LNRFKDVNDTFGHHCGDLLLQQIAQRLCHTLRDSDTVARLGGDEFAVLLPRADEVGAMRIGRKIVAALDESFEVEGQVFDVGVSIGCALYPDHGEDATSLMRRADVAMYVAKRTEVGYATYSSDQDEHSPDRLALMSDLRAATAGDQLSLHYQPQIDIKTGSVDHVEALARWRHPERGFVPPDTFICLAEETGLIKPLTKWVLNEALRQRAAWQASGLDIRVAVNLSARSLHDPELVDTITDLLQVWGVNAPCLEVEITESAIIVDPDRAMKTLTRLHEMGVWISIDDFGTGYSSLAHLKRLPVDQIKIDRSFVMDMTENVDNAFIVRSIIDLSHNLGLKVVAEGVENQETLDMLAAMDCDMAQGYHLSKPLPTLEMTVWFTRPKLWLLSAS
jgi:diguanylate cyclase (GGDEF)-like protein